MLKHFLTNAKAYAALIGSVVSALLATAAPGSTLFTVLTVASVVLTAVATWGVPNLTVASIPKLAVTLTGDATAIKTAIDSARGKTLNLPSAPETLPPPATPPAPEATP